MNISVSSTCCSLLSMKGKGPLPVDCFKKLGVDRAKLLQALNQVRGNQRVTSNDPESTYEALAKYGRDLVEEVKSGKLDPVIGRDEEIRRVIRILSRKTKNNPVLIGEPGVGKTAIVEGAGPPYRAWRCSRGAQREDGVLPRYGSAGRRGQVSW